jgi:hypothetical protein
MSRASVYNAQNPQNTDEVGEDPKTLRYLLRTTTVQHGLNLNPCYFATVSDIQHRTLLSHDRRHGASAVATRKHAPIWAKATLEAAGNAVECWQDIGRDKSERHQCAQCTRRSHAASNVDHQAQAEQL